ncbi:MAG: protein translocase subunit SecDF [Chitinophagales bacterium]|nr:protein translocase subunit SecDF [Chitinophagales bacterium]
MQGKGLVRVVSLLLIAICTYQLLFTWKANQIEKQAVAIAETQIPSGDANALYPNNLLQQFLYKDSIHKERIEYKNRYLDSLAPEKVFLGTTFKKVKENELSLGLDLQGGMSAVLQVNVKELLMSLSDNNSSPVFIEALDLAESRMSQSADDYITLFTKALKEKNPTAKLANYFATRTNSQILNSNSSDEDVLKYIREESENAIHRTYNIISARVDQFGLKQPNITLEPKKGRITVEIGGVDNPARVRKMLQATASLEFWETYKANELGGAINEANDAVKLYLSYTKGGKTVANATDSTNPASATATLDDILSEDNTKDTTKKLTETEQQKQAQKDFPLFSIFYPSIDQNNQYVESPVIGRSANIDTALVNQYLNVAEVKAKFPKDIEFMWGAKPIGDKNNIYELYAIKKRPGTDKPFIDGGAVETSKPDLDQFGNVTISMKMTHEGASKWKKMTGSNVGRNIAIVVDNEVYSAPNVNEEISGGSSSISGAFTQEEATDLSNILKIGKLPASANIVEEDMVGATLGAESIKAGLLSMLVGFILVIAFMMFYYSTLGIAATIVLFFNVFLIVGIMAILGSTLTLPGIAGIVLTMGMAVDANVLIYERIKEELKLGHSFEKAAGLGFKHALPAIIDGNVTTMITGIILFLIGMGPIKGFATTLIIGIITTLFTAVLVSNLIVERWIKKGRNIKASNKLFDNFLTETKFDFLKGRKLKYIISIVILSAGAISFFTRGFESGVDFKGGRQYKVRFEQAVNTANIKESLDNSFQGSTIVKTIGSDNQIKVTTSFLIDKNSAESDHLADSTLYLGLQKYLPENTSYDAFKQINLLSQQKVDPTISVDIIKSSTWAVILSILAIFIYILVRFRTFGYSIGAIASTIHDAFILLAIYTLLHGILPFSLEVDQTFIAALLTVIGYSLNDTVVIFDRLREYSNIPEQKKLPLASQMNNAINSTLARTFNTGITTIIPLIILFFFGGDTLKSFSFAMAIGVVIGTYSSVFVASPIMYEYEQWRQKREAKKANQ